MLQVQAPIEDPVQVPAKPMGRNVTGQVAEGRLSGLAVDGCARVGSPKMGMNLPELLSKCLLRVQP